MKMDDGDGVGEGFTAASYAVGTVALGGLAVLGPVRGGTGRVGRARTRGGQRGQRRTVSPLIRVRERRTRRHGVWLLHIAQNGKVKDTVARGNNQPKAAQETEWIHSTGEHTRPEHLCVSVCSLTPWLKNNDLLHFYAGLTAGLHQENLQMKKVVKCLCFLYNN